MGDKRDNYEPGNRSTDDYGNATEQYDAGIGSAGTSRNITEEVEKETGSAGPSFTEEVQPQPPTHPAPIYDRMVASGQVLGGYRESTPEERAKQEANERRYERRELLMIAINSFGGNIPTDDALNERVKLFDRIIGS